jgi:hypothetical protein
VVGAWLKANAAAVALLVVAAGAGTAAVLVPGDDDDGGGGSGDPAFCDPAEQAFGSGVTVETLSAASQDGLLDQMIMNAPNSEVEGDLQTLSQAIVEQDVPAETAEAAAADLVSELNSLCDLGLAPISTTTSSSTSSSTSSPSTAPPTTGATTTTTSSTTTTTTTTTTTSTPPPT